jgi:hypothetical protein
MHQPGKKLRNCRNSPLAAPGLVTVVRYTSTSCAWQKQPGTSKSFVAFTE